MKKIQFLTASAAIAAMMLTACTEKVDFAQEDLQAAAGTVDDNSIQFGTYLSNSAFTRAGATGNINTNTLKGFDATGTYNEDNAKQYGFGVFAYYTGTKTYGQAQGKTYTGEGTEYESGELVGNFMFNQQVYYDQNAQYNGYVNGEVKDGNYYSWYYTPIKYWPNEVTNDQAKGVDDQDNDANTNAAYTDYKNGGNVSFFAYAPYVTLSETAIKGTGITAINSKTTLSDANKEKGDPTITYLIDPDGKTVDLLWGTYDGTDKNVNDEGNAGVTSNASATDGTYKKAILPNYTVNADLTKQKTNGKVGFQFKHALAKVGGSSDITDNSQTPKHGLMIILDIDDFKGAEVGGSKESDTKVTVNSITITNNLNGDEDINSSDEVNGIKEMTVNSGVFNLATGQWPEGQRTQVTSYTKEDGTSTTITGEIKHTIYPENTTETNVSATLNPVIAEKLASGGTPSLESSNKDNFFASSGDFANQSGVLTEHALAVYGVGTETNPLVFIPGTQPALKITVDYYVRTKDANLEKGYSEVRQVISKVIQFEKPVELNKQYSILLHLGLTSVKFTASVSDWIVDGDDNENGTIDTGEEVKIKEVYVPRNVSVVSAAISSAKSFEYTNSTPGSNAYTYFGTIEADEETVNYTIDLATAIEIEDGTYKIASDLARFLGALYRNDNGSTVNKITYNGTTYTWNTAGTLKGSNWEDESHKTLVSVLASDMSGWLSGLTATDSKDIIMKINDNAGTMTIHATVTK